MDKKRKETENNISRENIIFETNGVLSEKSKIES
jgi:hypothetical protein